MDIIWLAQEIFKKTVENGIAFFQNAQDKPVALVWVLIGLVLTVTVVMANHDHRKNKNPPE
ncbi:MAG TPA: hypothetical protein P5230_04340 [Candidatus Magasanikbacteria bacterium]|nr:hypothetical protein [Candidatus Magasanikbacteria bacterium]